VGDNVIVYHDQKKYEYRVYDKKVIKPSQVDILTQEGEDRLTLITCTPVGTDLNRLVLLARPI
jgi:sortase A